MKKILITGGAGFIGSHVVRRFVNKYPDYEIFNLDNLTYAGNLENLADIDSKPNYHFIKGDIADQEFIMKLFQEHQFDGVIHLAAESHVDRSISDPMTFVHTNVLGTVHLLNAARTLWNGNWEGKKYYQIANGQISEGTTITLREVKIGDAVLHNVDASVVKSQKAPLLLGQSAMERFGTITIDNQNNKLIIKH